MAIPSTPHHTVADPQRMSANGSPASEPVLLDKPRDDGVTLESSGHCVPSIRAIELETLLRQRDVQNEKLTVGILSYSSDTKTVTETRMVCRLR